MAGFPASNKWKYMAIACVFSPVDKDNKPYKALPKYKKEFGRETGTRAFLKALSPSFQKRNEKVLEIDAQGVATIQSALRTRDMRDFVGFEQTKKVLEKQYGFNEVENTADNFRMLVNEAKNFNNANPDYIAYPVVEGSNIKNTIFKKTPEAVEAFNNRYGSMLLNDRLLAIFEPLGLRVGDLAAAEQGYSGITDFSNAKSIAGEFINLIRVANSMSGQLSMSEEFSHLIVRMLRDQPNMQRLINAFTASPEALKTVLGEDYQRYVGKATSETGDINYSTLAEEAVGRLLQGKLQEEVAREFNTSYIGKLWRRLVDYIKRTFGSYSTSDVEQAITEADQTLGNLAKNILNGSMNFEKQDIEKTVSEERFFHLEDNLSAINQVIEDAINVETKKTVIINNDKAIERAERKIKNLNAVLKATPEGKLKGLINYALAAVTDLGIARDALLKSAPENRNFGMLRGVWSTILSYNNFIDQLGDIINSEDEELKKLIQETQVKNKDEVLHTLGTAYRELSALRDLVKSRYKSIAFDSIEEFFKPFFNVEGKFIDSLGRERTLRQLIEEASGDIGFVDTYFMTMSNSGDLLLQLFDEVVKKAKATARYDTIEDMHDIIRLMLKARDMGINSFEWMFEHDNSGRKTGNYISAVNTGQFEKDKREFMASLDEKYGENPTGENAKRKIAERKAWNDSHSVFFGAKPNATIYHNGEFDRLSTQQKEILMDFMQLKQKFDKRIPPNKVSTTRAIQMRRTSQQRLLDSFSDPARAFENIKETIAKELTRSSDDDAIYGERTGLRSFDGSEFKVLPVLYTARLSNPEELSTDVFSSLAAYSYSTNIYKQMEKVVDPLEVARNWVSDKENRRIREVSNGRGMVERVKGIVSPIYKNTNSNSIEKLDNFMDSQVYQRYYKDSDKTINVMGRELKAGKLVNKWLSVSSAVQLGFNALAHLANAATGVGMQNIEAFSGQYFNAKELAKADAAYLAAVKEYIHDIEAKNPRSKLALFDQLFDIKQEFGSNVKNQMNRLFEKLFGKSVAFLGQTCGDHWLYNRTAIAMCLRKKVKTKDGSITSLWEALQVENAFSGDDRIKKLTIDAVDAETGEKIDREYIRRYSAKINEINHRLFGVYNTDDMVAAQRVALGRCVLQYRQWIVPLFARRFQSRRYVAALGEYEEGYYRTVLHVLAGLRGGMEGLKETWEDLDEGQKRNIYRAITEMAQFFIIWAIANFCSFGKDDPDRVWALKFAEYMAQRELHELGNLTPSFTMGNEILKTVKSPASILNTTQAALNLTASILDPRDWFDEIESGKYEGMSTLHKNFLKAPFPILAPFNQLDRVLDNIEETTRYYARSY